MRRLFLFGSNAPGMRVDTYELTVLAVADDLLWLTAPSDACKASIAND